MDQIPQYLQLPKTLKRQYLKYRIPIAHDTTPKSTSSTAVIGRDKRISAYYTFPEGFGIPSLQR